MGVTPLQRRIPYKVNDALPIEAQSAFSVEANDQKPL